MKTDTIENLLSHVASQCSAVDVDAAYDEMLDECYSFESVGGIFACMCPSRVLLECDPVAYRCGKNDWVDGEGLVEIGDSWYRSEDLEEARDSFIEELEGDIAELQELDDENEEGPANAVEIDDLEAQIKTVRSYTF